MTILIENIACLFILHSLSNKVFELYKKWMWIYEDRKRTYRKRKERLEGNSSEYEDREAFQCLMLMKLWFDNWMGSSLVSLMEFPPHLFPRLKANLSFVMADGKWNIPRIILDFPLVAAQIMLVTLLVSPLPDKCIWIHSSDGELSAKLAFQFLNPSSPKLEWASVIWCPCIPPSHSFIFWWFMLSKLPTDENLQSRGCTLVSMCPSCSKHFLSFYLAVARHQASANHLPCFTHIAAVLCSTTLQLSAAWCPCSCNSAHGAHHLACQKCCSVQCSPHIPARDIGKDFFADCYVGRHFQRLLFIFGCSNFGKSVCFSFT